MDSLRDIVEELFSHMRDDRRSTVDDLFAEDTVVSLPDATLGRPIVACDFLAHLESRYGWVAREFDRWIEAGDTVVSVRSFCGAASGSSEFSDVRYVGIHVARRGLIERLDIWNDLAVDGVVPITDVPVNSAEE